MFWIQSTATNATDLPLDLFFLCRFLIERQLSETYLWEKKQFSEFKNEKKLSNIVLTDTLKFMEDNNLIVKKTFENDPNRISINLKRI